jgi:signal transduction histidine kinase
MRRRIKKRIIGFFDDSQATLIATTGESSSVVIQESVRRYQESIEKIYRRTDRMFVGLLSAEWLFGILCAAIISPRTWSGTMSQVHLHVWAALIMGGLIISAPVYLGIFHPGKILTRHLIAIAQVLMSALLIHLTGGRIETHFHVFGSLAFLSFYRDWRVVASATVVVALDHMLRGFFWPESVYGVMAIQPWRWLEHAGWVLFEDLFLIPSCVQGRKELFAFAHKSVITDNQVKSLKETQGQLVQSGKLAALGELSSGIAHELNNPLHFIKSFNRRIRETYHKSQTVSFADIETFVDKINDNCNRMQRIVQHFRDFSRQTEHKLMPIAINEIVSRSFTLFNEQLRLHSINVKLSLSPENPYVLGDGNRLEQVLVNLIGNARDAMEKTNNGEKVIEVVTSLNHDTVEVRVKDSGCGIADDIAAHIFDPFFTTKEVGKGTGLGLSISHSIIQEHQGQITCVSQPGKGSEFKITLRPTEETAET